MIIKVDAELYKVLESTHITPGKGQALMQTKLRKLRDQSLHDYRFRSKDKVEHVYVEEIQMEYLYQDGEDFIFMNQVTFEQIRLSSDIIGNAVHYLVANVVFSVEFYEKKPVGINPPITIDLKVTKTEPFLKWATQSASSKPATLETGLTLNVPQFIKEGDIIRIDTREDRYIERA